MRTWKVQFWTDRVGRPQLGAVRQSEIVLYRCVVTRR